MARYLGPKGKIVRRFGMNIFENPKFDRLLKKKPYGPGQNANKRRKKISDYAIQLMEKQKIKYMYGILERQFRRYFDIASRKKGITGDNLIILLETRLDNIIYRMHILSTRNQARQFIRHGHIQVNGRLVDIPSYQVKKDDVITVRDKSKKLRAVLESLKRVGADGVVPWIEVNPDEATGIVKQIPRRSEIKYVGSINEQLVVELYSK